MPRYFMIGEEAPERTSGNTSVTPGPALPDSIETPKQEMIVTCTESQACRYRGQRDTTSRRTFVMHCPPSYGSTEAYASISACSPSLPGWAFPCSIPRMSVYPRSWMYLNTLR